ncbi:MAG TPA: PAS domain-containing protein [Rhizomicrobium sp.]|jgi:hypothetical protein
MKHRNSHLLVGYWSRLALGRDVPDQTDIEPRAIKRMLPNVFVLDARNAAAAFYRLAGTLLCDRFGQELRGSAFLAHWDSNARGTLEALMKKALADRQAICLSAIGTTSRCATIEMETVLAPLSFHGGRPRRFLGITQFLGDCTSLGGLPITSERLIEHTLIHENESSNAQPPSSVPERPRSQQGSTPHLRLVASQETPVSTQFQVDNTMTKLKAALEIQPAVRIVR